MLVWNILLRVYFVVFFLGEEEGEILDFLACRRYEDETIDRCAIFFFMLLRVTVGYSRGGGSRYEDPFFAGIDLFSFQLG